MINKVQNKISSFFTKGHERTLLAKRNIVGSFAVKGATILMTFVSYPLTLDYLNPTRYGIWIALSSIISWMLFFDIGLGNGLKNKFAESKAKGEIEKARQYVSSTYAIFLILISVIVLIFVFVNPFISWVKILNVDAGYATELRELVWISFLSFSFLFVLRLLTSVITADQKAAFASFIDMLSQLLSLIGVFFLVKTTEGSLIKLGWVLGISPIVVYLIASLILYNTKYRQFRPSLKHVDFGLAKQMVNLGMKFFIAGMAALVLFQTTNVLISNIVGPEEVSVYNAAFRIFTVGYNVLGIIVFPYWSAFSDAYALNDYEWMKSSIKKLHLIFILFVLAQGVILACSDWIYKFWIKDMVTIPFSMSLSVFLYICGLAWVVICMYPLNGIGKIKLQFYTSILEMIFIIPLAYFLGTRIGSIGIVISPILVSVPRMIWGPVQLGKLINRTAKGIWNK